MKQDIQYMYIFKWVILWQNLCFHLQGLVQYLGQDCCWSPLWKFVISSGKKANEKQGQKCFENI